MLYYMLDTDLCIRVMRNAPDTIVGRLNRHATQLCISAITLGELCFGAEKSRNVAANLDRIEQFVARLAVLDFDPEAARHYGQMRDSLLRHPIGANDMLIAAHARSRNLTLVTWNANEFGRVPGLRVEDWL